MEWLLVAFLNGNAQIVAQVSTQTECWLATRAVPQELKEAKLACYELAVEFEKREQATP